MSSSSPFSSSSGSTVISSRPIEPHIQTSCQSCSCPFEFPVPTNPLPKPGTLLRISCFSCKAVTNHAFYPTQIPSSSKLTSSSSHTGGGGAASGANASSTPPPRKGRKIGTQEKPLETAYYDLLGVPVTATSDDIKKAYRRLAIKHHPDKNPDDPQASERFQSIAIAYQTLSDPQLRAKYNEFGAKETAPEGGFVDPEEVFGAIFGGDRFVPIIGNISLARDMKTALQEADDEEEEGGEPGKPVLRDEKGRVIVSEEEKRKKEEKERKKSEERSKQRKERVDKLVENLTRKLSIFTESATGPNDRDVTQSFRTICQLEAEDLKRESYGPDLLQAIGFVYVSKAKHHLATHQTLFGMGGWLHNVQGKYHVFSETVSTLRSALELKSVFEQIQAAEKAGNLTPEEKKKLEDQAAEKGLKALFKGAKLEIESVLRETCDIILDPGPSPSTASQTTANMRAVALQILGEAYASVKKDDAGPGEEGGTTDESEYVRVETKASRARDSTGAGPVPQSPGPGASAGAGRAQGGGRTPGSGSFGAGGWGKS